MLGRSDRAADRGLRPGDARPRRRRLHRAATRCRARPSTSPRPGPPGCGSRSSPTTRRGRRRRWRRTCASSGSPADADDVVTSAQAAARVLRRAARRRARGWCCWAAAGSSAALRGGGPGAGRRVDDDAEAVVTGYGPDVLLARHHAGRGADPRRAVVGRQQHRPDDPDGVRRGARATACWSRRCGGSAGSSRWWPASRPGRCSTRPCAGCGGERPLMVGDRLDTDIEGAHNAGVDSLLVLTGRDRAGRAGGGAARGAADVPLRRPGRPARRAHPAPELPTDAAVAGRLDGAGVTTVGSTVDRRGRGRRLVAGGRRVRGAGAHLGRVRASLVDTDGLAAAASSLRRMTRASADDRARRASRTPAEPRAERCGPACPVDE